ncbi:MAG: ABC transporter permease [Acetivibrionales bacterium]|jgi:ribose/xylose/arabinose/galactoside ABC-type transport system permease subunit
MLNMKKDKTDKTKMDKTLLISKLNNNRIYVFLLIVMVIMSISAPNFLGTGNIVPMIKTSLLSIMVGIGFTYVMIAGNFDLSIGAIINVGAAMVMGEFNRFFAMFGGEAAGTGAVVGAWAVAIIIALAAGALVGLINGLLVAKGKVHSFIVTIGMMTALSGFVYTYSKGNTISADNTLFVDIIEKPFVRLPYLQVFTIRFLIVVIALVFFEILLLKTKWGRDLLMVGSNKEAAWHAGINTDNKVMSSFIISGLTAAFGGILFAISMNAAVPNYGERGINPLMMVLASTIIGGTVMTGGKGSVVKTAVAVITIQAIFNGLIILGMGFDAQVLAAGVLLAAVVIYESYSIYKQNLKKGERAALLKEAAELRARKKALN